jgi:hypothetical protein
MLSTLQIAQSLLSDFPLLTYCFQLRIFRSLRVRLNGRQNTLLGVFEDIYVHGLA